MIGQAQKFTPTATATIARLSEQEVRKEIEYTIVSFLKWKEGLVSHPDVMGAECVKNGETKNNEKIDSKGTQKKGATNSPLRGKGSGGKATMCRGSALRFQGKQAG